MQVVFIHGVANRRKGDVDDGFDQAVAKRNLLFNTWVFDRKAQFHNPYWGDLGGRLRADGVCVPTKKSPLEAYGAPNELPEVALVGDPQFGFGLAGKQMKALALQDREGFVDVLLSTSDPVVQDPEEYAALAVRLRGFTEQGDWSWLPGTKDDADLMERLAAAVANFQPTSPHESFGPGDLLNQVRSGFKRAVDSVIDKTSDALMLKFKPAITNGAAAFLGDAFVHFDTRNEADVLNPIAAKVLHDLTAAWQAAQANGQKLVVVVHSFGGTVLWELLTFYRQHLPPGLRIDAVISVGTQIGLFLELDVYGAKLADLGVHDLRTQKVPKPAGVGAWLNVLDYADPLGFQLAPLVEGVRDHEFNTVGNLLNSHNLYFTRESFYRRTRVRLQELGVI